MDILYPKDYEVETPAKAAGDKAKLNTFIKNLVKTEPKTFSEIVDAVDDNYCKTNDESMHFMAEDVREVMNEVEAEFRPVAVEEPVVEEPVVEEPVVEEPVVEEPK